VLDLLPPPFPFTACVLAAGALKVDRPLFFVTLGVTRLLRFGVEAVLAYFYGRHIVTWLKSPILEYIGIGFVVAAIMGSIITTIQVVRKSRNHRRQQPRAKRGLSPNPSYSPSLAEPHNIFVPSPVTLGKHD
jgi:hypothetical protein